jgi:hypothetical protein
VFLSPLAALDGKEKPQIINHDTIACSCDTPGATDGIPQDANAIGSSISSILDGGGVTQQEDRHCHTRKSTSASWYVWCRLLLVCPVIRVVCLTISFSAMIVPFFRCILCFL